MLEDIVKLNKTMGDASDPSYKGGKATVISLLKKIVEIIDNNEESEGENSLGVLELVKEIVELIKVKTDNLPSDPASQGMIEEELSTIKDGINSIDIDIPEDQRIDVISDSLVNLIETLEIKFSEIQGAVDSINAAISGGTGIASALVTLESSMSELNSSFEDFESLYQDINKLDCETLRTIVTFNNSTGIIPCFKITGAVKLNICAHIKSQCSGDGIVRLGKTNKTDMCIGDTDLSYSPPGTIWSSTNSQIYDFLQIKTMTQEQEFLIGRKPTTNDIRITVTSGVMISGEIEIMVEWKAITEDGKVEVI